jgi:hypothetical protein
MVRDVESQCRSKTISLMYADALVAVMPLGTSAAGGTVQLPGIGDREPVGGAHGRRAKPGHPFHHCAAPVPAGAC